MEVRMLKFYLIYYYNFFALLFRERLINRWNCLPNSVIFATMLCFKRSLDTVDFSLLAFLSIPMEHFQYVYFSCSFVCNL